MPRSFACKAHMQLSCSRWWWEVYGLKVPLTLDLILNLKECFYLTVLLMHNRGEKCWEEGWHVTNVPCSHSALIAGKYAVMQCWCRGGESYDSAQYIMILLGNFYISPIPFHWHSGGGSGGWLRAEIIALERRRMFLIQTESPLIAEPCKDPATIRELPH